MDKDRIERVARALSVAKGRDPDEKISLGYLEGENQRLGFEASPFQGGVWLCEVPEAAKFVAAMDALKDD